MDGVTVKRFEEAARNGDIAQPRVMLKQRPELVNSAALRHAVLRRDDTMVRMLMEHGGKARTGVYPHRDATTPLVIATDRGYDEIVAIIKEAERFDLGFDPNERTRMKDVGFRKPHLFVGSGVIEAGCKTASGHRLKQFGMFWTVKGATAILAPRCSYLNGRFANYW